MNENQITIAYRPSLDKRAKAVFEEVFGQGNIQFGEYINKGIVGASYDQFFIVTVGAIGLNLLSNIIYDLAKKMFYLKEDKSRPVYTIIVLRTPGQIMQVDNMNSENEIFISSAGNPPVKLRGLNNEQVNMVLTDLTQRAGSKKKK